MPINNSYAVLTEIHIILKIACHVISFKRCQIYLERSKLIFVILWHPQVQAEKMNWNNQIKIENNWMESAKEFGRPKIGQQIISWKSNCKGQCFKSNIVILYSISHYKVPMKRVVLNTKNVRNSIFVKNECDSKCCYNQ